MNANLSIFALLNTGQGRRLCLVILCLKKKQTNHKPARFRAIRKEDGTFDLCFHDVYVPVKPVH